MTDIEAVQEAADSPMVKALLRDLKPELRKEIWKAALICAAITGACVYALSRKDIADLRSELNRPNIGKAGRIESRYCSVEEADRSITTLRTCAQVYSRHRPHAIER
jgi:hypothetical protein